MAKTTSQIVAENKQRRAEEQGIRAQRSGQIFRDYIVRNQVKTTPSVPGFITTPVSTKYTNYKAPSLPGFESGSNLQSTNSVIDRNKDILKHPKKYQKEWENQKKAEEKAKQNQQAAVKIGAMTDDQRQAMENAALLGGGKKAPDWLTDKYGEQTAKETMESYSDMKEEEETMEKVRKQREEQAKNQAVLEEQLKKIETMTPEERKALDLYNQMQNKQTYSGNPEFYQGAMADAMSALGGYSNEEIAQMAEALRWSYSAEHMERVKENAQEFGHEHHVIGSIGSVGSNLVGAVTAPLGYLGEMVNRTGQFTTLNPNNMGTGFQQQGAELQGAVTEDIVGDGSSDARKALGYLYQGTMSFADSMARVVAAGPAGSLALAGMGSFGQTMQEASVRGATPEQAVLLATADAGLEVLTEKIPLDEWLKVANGNPQTFKNALVSAFKQAGIEPTTEEISYIGGLLADAAIMGEKSEYKQNIADMVASGMSYSDAKKNADNALLQEAKDTAIVSWISGAISGGSGAVISGINRNQTQDQTAVNQDMFDQTADAINHPRAEAPVQQTAEDVRSAADDIMGVEEPTGPEKMGVDDGETYLSRKEKGERYKQSKVNAAILDMVNRVKNGIAKAGEKIRLTPISDKNAAKIQQETGVDVRGYDTVIEARQIDHILKRHGENGVANHTMADPTDIARIEYALENPDRIVKSEPTRAYVSIKDGKNKPADTVLYETLLEDGSYYVVQAVPDTKKHTLYVLTAYIGESSIQNEAPRFSGTASPILTSETQDTIASDEAMQSSDAGNYEDTSGASANIVPPGINNVNENLQGESLSAAKEGFTGKQGYYDLLTDENTQRDRAGDVRPMELPKHDINGGKVSEVTGNVYGSKIAPDELASLMEMPTAMGDFSYTQISNDQAAQMAMDTIAAGETWENAFDLWKRDIDRGVAGAEVSARAAFLLNHFAESGNKQQWLETLHYTQMLGTNTAQGLQALRMIRTLNPQDKVAFARMTIQRAVADMTQKYKTKIDMTAAEPLIQQLEQADTDVHRDEILGNIQQIVADQIPSTALDKWTALRYTNMLGNLKTMVRNVAGNVAMQMQYRIKDTIAAGMEQIASVLTDGKVERTKSVTVGKDLMKACREDFQQYKGIVADGGKYGDRISGKDQFRQGVEEKRTIFKNKLMETYRKGTNWAMNNEYFGDEAFGREGYVRALAGYLKANGVKDADLSKVDNGLMDKARAYAIQQAQEATFHDATALSRTLSKLQRDAGVVGEGILPFVKTPANALVRAEEYSPLGFINSTVKTIEGIQGTATGAEVIDSWAKTFTGTGLVAIGAFLKAQGWITGGPDDDKDKETFDKMNGEQPYSIIIPGVGSYTMDWLNPTAMPVFMGAQFWDLFSAGREDITFADVEQIFASLADPMIQMSMLQGLNDTLDGIKYTDNNLGQFFINAAVSYLTQGMSNTLLGQLEKNTEKTRTYTYVDKDSDVPAWAQKTLGKVSQKIPGWDYHQAPYRNGWGEEEEQPSGLGGLLYNMLSPGYFKPAREDPVTDELNRLYDQEGVSGGVFPSFQATPITYTDGDGNKHKDYNMTAEEVDRYQETAGQTAKSLMDKLVQSEEYQAMSDEEKNKAREYVYDYAREKGRAAALDGYEISDSWVQNLEEGKEQDAVLMKVSGGKVELNGAAKIGLEGLQQRNPNDQSFLPDNQPPLEFNWDGEKVALSTEERKTYHQTYEDKVSSYYSALYRNNGFQNMSDEQKISALNKAKEYANGNAKAAVSDYDDAVNGTADEIARKIVNDTTINVMTDIFDDIDRNKRKGIGNAENVKALNDIYDDVMTLPKTQRDNVMNSAEGDLGKYFDAREAGVVTSDFVRARDAVKNAPGTGSVAKDTGKPSQTNADKWGAIAGLGRMTDDTIDRLMKSWMTDYDPAAKSPDRTELKYDYARKELGLSPSEYVEAYRVNGQYSKKADKIAAFEELGFDKNTALQLYKLYGGSDKKFNQKLVELYGG